jgi:glycosyltransferase involved in cell wall biosynthesis
VIANSPKVRSEILKFYGVRGRNVTIIPGGYARATKSAARESLRRELGLPSDGFLFLFCGRPDPVKNFSGAVDAFRRVHTRYPDTYLVLAPRQDLTASEGIVGVELPPQRMYQLYGSVDALIHPGFYEAYSLAIHEALANGLAAIIGRDTGNACYCKHGVNAMVLPPVRGTKLIDALAETMCSLIESKELRMSLGREAEREFGPMDWDWVAEKTSRVYSLL